MLNSATKFLKNGQDYITYGEYVAKYKTGNNFGEIEDEIIIDFTDSNYIFSSESALYAWTYTKPSAKIIRQKLDSSLMWQAYAQSRNMLDNETATNNYVDSIINQDMNRDPTPFFTGLYDLPNYTGMFYWYPLISIRPSLGSFNGRASSLADYFIVPKLNMLASRTWYRGSKLFYWSWRTIDNLVIVNYDNKASSKL